MPDMWHIRGVSEEARRMAKGAAGLTGITLGKWLETAIANQADLDSGPRPVLTVEGLRAAIQPKAGTQKVCKHGIAWPHCRQCPKDVDYD